MLEVIVLFIIFCDILVLEESSWFKMIDLFITKKLQILNILHFNVEISDKTIKSLSGFHILIVLLYIYTCR